MWEIISSIAAALGAIAAAVSLAFAVKTQIESVNRTRRQATIEAFARLQEEVLDKLASFTEKEILDAAKNCTATEGERILYYDYKVLIARLEHFAVGINEGTYDFDTFYNLGGVHVGFLYTKVKPIIVKARNRAENGIVPFKELEKLFESINQKAKTEGITIH